jgi:uncharacterized membrane protein
MRFSSVELKETEMENGYLWLKTLHVLGAVLFLGNIIVTGWWKVMADRTRDPRIIAFAQRQVTLTDYVFTLGGVVLVLASGLANIRLHGIAVGSNPWLAWGIGLFVASGVIWVLLLVPVQARLARLASSFAAGGEIPGEYWRLCRRWNFWGAIATLLPVSILYFMVFKGAA